MNGTKDREASTVDVKAMIENILVLGDQALLRFSITNNAMLSVDIAKIAAFVDGRDRVVDYAIDTPGASIPPMTWVRGAAVLYDVHDMADRLITLEVRPRDDDGQPVHVDGIQLDIY